MMPTLPHKAVQLLAAIGNAGGQGYLVGGALRDLMLGRTPDDWDFAATLPPEALLRLLPGARLIGGRCGTVEVPFGNGRCQVTPCRTEAQYSDGRHPDRVDFVPDILADLARRDFTVNAMACNGAILLDPFGGQQDLRRRQLRCVGNADKRFGEDALRVLRLFRLAAQLGFTAQWETFCAAGRAMPTVGGLPAPRVLAEVRRMLMSDSPQIISGIIVKGGLQRYGFEFVPQLAPMAAVPRLWACRLWALAALCGAPLQVVGQGFGFSRRLTGQLEEMSSLYRAGPATSRRELKLKLRNSALDYAPIAATFAAVSPAYVGEPMLYDAVCARGEAWRIGQLAIGGEALRAEGITGKRCGEVLHQLQTAVINNPALNKPKILLGLARGLQTLAEAPEGPQEQES